MIKTKNRQSRPIKYGVAPTKERRHQNGGVYKEVIDRDANGKVFMNRYRAVWECPLDVYWDKGLISVNEYKAGLEFQRAYYGAVICRREQCTPVSKNQASTERTMNDRLLDEAYKLVRSEDMGTIIDVCGHSIVTWSPQALEKLRRGLGHLAIEWVEASVEVCERSPKLL